MRVRVLDAASDLIEAGEDVTFAKVAAAAAVPERTVYRYFPNRDALIAALFEHTNRRIGFTGELPTTVDEMTAMVERVFPGFDTVAPVVAELLSSPEGRRARIAGADDRRAAADVGRARGPPRPRPRRCSARSPPSCRCSGPPAVWQALRDFWDMDGDEAAAAVTAAIDSLLTDPTTPTTGDT